MWEYCNDFVLVLKSVESTLEYQESSRKEGNLFREIFITIYFQKTPLVGLEDFIVKGSCPEIFTARLRY